MALVEEQIVAAEDPLSRAATHLRAVLKQNAAVLKSGEIPLNDAILSNGVAEVGFPTAFIAATDCRLLPDQDARFGEIGFRVDFVITCAIARLDDQESFKAGYAFGDRLCAVLRRQDNETGYWEELLVGPLSVGELRGGSLGVQVKVAAIVFIDYEGGS